MTAAGDAPASDAGRQQPLLYGVPGAERLFDDPAAAYEDAIEPWYEPKEKERHEIEEWSVAPKRSHFPTVELLHEWVAEWTSENGLVTEDFYDHLDAVLNVDEVKAATDALLDLMASKVQYTMTADHLRSLWVTWSEDGEPLLDGEPMCRPAAASPTEEDDRG